MPGLGSIVLDSSKELASLYRDMKWQQVIGRPENISHWILKIFLNGVLVLAVIRFAILMSVPAASDITYLGNLMQVLGYNNSLMFFVTAFSYGTAVMTFQLVFELAEYRNQKQFLEDNFDLENKVKEWKVCEKEVKEIKTTAAMIIKLCRFMTTISGGICYLILFLALLISLQKVDLWTHRILLVFWYLFLCVFCHRAVTVFFFVIMMQFIPVQVLRLRYASLNRKLQEAKSDQDMIAIMDEHERISASCRAYNQSFRWMIAAINDLSTPAVAVTVYNVVYTDFGSQFDKVNAYIFCSLLITSTLMITFIPCGTARQSQAAYPALMSAASKLKLTHHTRIRMLNFCKRISIKTAGHVGFSDGTTRVFTKAAAIELVFDTVSMWFLYASMRLEYS